MWLPLKRPLLGTWPTAQACALTSNQTSDPLVCRPALNPLSHTSQGTIVNYMCIISPPLRLKRLDLVEKNHTHRRMFRKTDHPLVWQWKHPRRMVPIKKWGLGVTERGCRRWLDMSQVLDPEYHEFKAFEHQSHLLAPPRRESPRGVGTHTFTTRGKNSGNSTLVLPPNSAQRKGPVNVWSAAGLWL